MLMTDPEPPGTDWSREPWGQVAETHSAVVFFAGDRAFKLNKPGVGGRGGPPAGSEATARQRLPSAGRSRRWRHRPDSVRHAARSYADHVAYGHGLIRTAIDQAVGQMPGDVPVEQQVVYGRAAAELASFARGDDLVVLGSRRRGWLRQLAPGSVAWACARRSDCPVVIVPEPPPRALVVPLQDDHVRGHWFRRMPHRGAQAASCAGAAAEAVEDCC
jgi:nucleotide-binding universal stress UspA family protein